MASRFTAYSPPSIQQSDPFASTSAPSSPDHEYSPFETSFKSTLKQNRPITWPKPLRSQVAESQLPWDPFTSSTIPLQWAHDQSTVESLKSIVDNKPATKTRPVKMFAWAKNILSITSDRPRPIHSPKRAEEADSSTTLESHDSGEHDHLEHIQQIDYKSECLVESTNNISTGEDSIPIDDSVDISTSTSDRYFTKSLLPEATIPVNQPAERDSVDELCDLLPMLVIDDSGQESPKRIIVPVGYKFGMSKDAKSHYDEIAYFKAGTSQSKLYLGKRKRLQIGFRPHEVLQKGALHASDLDMGCTLTGNIHPVFDEEHWTDCPNYIFEVIKPALLLASKFLATPQCMQHFQTAWKGHRKFCIPTSKQLNTVCYRINNDVPLTPESAKNVLEYITSLAGTLSFQFLTKSDSPSQESRYFATAQTVPCHNQSSILNSPQTTLISLHEDLYTQAHKLSTMQFPDQAQVLRFQFFLAMNLLHEFAHAFEIACSPVQTRLGWEVYMYSWLDAESGRAWETGTFGGKITAVNDRCDGLHGICVVEWPEPGLENRDRTGQAAVRTVSMEYIHSLFQEEKWDEIREKPVGEKGLFLVPEGGATSVGLCSFTTARYEDVVRERELGDIELTIREIAEEAGIGTPLLDGEVFEPLSRKKAKV